MASRTKAALAEQAYRKMRALKRCQRSSWHLAINYLGYGWSEKHKKGLTRRVHKPIMDWYDRHREDPFLGLWMARSHHKTTMVVAWLIQELLRDPFLSHYYFHAVEREADDLIKEVGSHFRYPDGGLRRLDPIGISPKTGESFNVCPHPSAKKWLKAQSIELDAIRRNRPPGAGTRAPFLRSRGAGSEVTGSHIDGRAFLDDIISRNTIINSELTKIQAWTQNTVFPVVDSNKMMCTGTPWSEQSVHQIWQSDPDWHTLIVPGSIAESDADFKRMVDAA